MMGVRPGGTGTAVGAVAGVAVVAGAAGAAAVGAAAAGAAAAPDSFLYLSRSSALFSGEADRRASRTFL